MKKIPDEMPLQTGTTQQGDDSGRKLHAGIEVRMFLLDATVRRGERETVLCCVAGDSVTIVENKGRPAPDWLRNELLARLSKKSSGGVEQA